jgi:hypothetical protein
MYFLKGYSMKVINTCGTSEFGYLRTKDILGLYRDPVQMAKLSFVA